jgi:hypothetical protein
MSNIVSKSKNYEKCSTGLQQAVCVFVNDIGTQIGEYQGKRKELPKVIISWELKETIKDGDYAGKRFMMNKYYTKSLYEMANLTKDLENWRGKKFTQEELNGFDLDNLIGANCYLNIVVTEKDYRKVSAVLPLPRDIEKLKPEMTEMSDGMKKWIDSERAKSMEMQPENNHVDKSDESLPRAEPVDDLPF